MTANSKRSLRVLVVEDEPAVADSVARILAFARHRPEVVLSAEEGLRIFEAGKFDLVITDYAMPGLNGDAFAAAIRARAPAQRIVILTGFGEVFAAAGVPAVADLVVDKPFEMREFLAAIGRLFEAE